MNYFKLLPLRTLTVLHEHYHSAIIDWLSNWSKITDQKINDFKVINTHEKSDEIKQHKVIYEITDDNGNNLNIIDPQINDDYFFNKVLFGSDFTGMQSDLMSSVISDAISSLCVDVFELSNPTLNIIEYSINSDLNINNYIAKGSGSVTLEIDVNGLMLYIVITNKLVDGFIVKESFKYDELGHLSIEELQIHDRELNISASLEKTSLKYKDLVNLKKNDVLVLDHKTNENIKLKINEDAFCDAQLGSLNGNKAVSLN